MYELLSKEEEEEFRSDVSPIVKRDTKIPPVREEKPFNVYVGKYNRAVSNDSLILSGVYVEHLKTGIVKFLISQAPERIKSEQGAYIVFCEMLLDHFVKLTKEKSLQSLLMHTSDLTVLEVLLKNKFEITKTKNNFYRAFKVLN